MINLFNIPEILSHQTLINLIPQEQELSSLIIFMDRKSNLNLKDLLMNKLKEQIKNKLEFL